MNARFSLVALLLSGIVGFSGCAKQQLAKNLVKAPNLRGPDTIAQSFQQAGQVGSVMTKDIYAETWNIAGGEPAAQIAVGVIEPGYYGFNLRFAEKIVGQTRDINMTFHMERRTATVPCRGTVVCLHGYGESRHSMIFWGLTLAQHGYRSVLVDLRGHGDSTGKWINFGVSDVSDLRKVVNELQRRGLVGDEIGVLGVSYGAAVGILWAADDPRVKTIVAMEPYAEPKPAIAQFIRSAAGKLANLFSDDDFAWAEERAAKLAKFSWDDANPLAVVGNITGPMLFLHGKGDQWVPLKNSEKLSRKAAPGSRLIVVSENEHTVLPVRLDLMAGDVNAWFDTHLAADPQSRPGP